MKNQKNISNQKIRQVAEPNISFCNEIDGTWVVNYAYNNKIKAINYYYEEPDGTRVINYYYVVV